MDRLGVILCYHRVVQDKIPDPYELCLKTEVFEEHLQLLHSSYNVVSLTHLLQQLEMGEANKDKQVVITFDDGYAATITYAMPLLLKYQMPATLFVPAGGIDEQRFWWDDLAVITANMTDVPLSKRSQVLWNMNEKLRALTIQERNMHIQVLAQKYHCLPLPLLIGAGLANWDDIRAWKAAGLDVEGHGYHHLSVADRPTREINSDLMHAQSRFYEELNSPASLFAYPFGLADCSPETDIYSVFSNNGIRAAFTADLAMEGKAVCLEQSLYHLPRVDVSSCSTKVLRHRLEVLLT